MKDLRLLLIALVMCACGGLPSTKEAGISFPTMPSVDADQEFEWEAIGTAKEMVNASELKVVMSGGVNPVTAEEWPTFKATLPWVKNIDRNILFTKTALLRSPYASENCTGADCFDVIEYKGHTWLELAKPLAIDYIPDETDTKKPEAGHVVIKTIKKCQVIYFEDFIYQLSDGKGNYYVMHASESKKPSLDAQHPKGWTLKKIAVEEPLVVVPFGGEGDCYFNILGDNLGQGYHQYIFAGDTYP